MIPSFLRPNVLVKCRMTVFSRGLKWLLVISTPPRSFGIFSRPLISVFLLMALVAACARATPNAVFILKERCFLFSR